LNSNFNNNLTVVHSNELIEAGYGHTIDELRLINLALTKINSKKENPGEIDIYPEEFSEMFNLNSKNVWRNMKNAIDKIMSKPVKMYRQDENGKEKTVQIVWLVRSEYYSNQNDGTKLSIKFSPEITPYLFEIKDRFTSLNFEYASKLTTPFSYRLYSWLIESKNLDKNKSGETICVELEIEWMKERANLKGEYDRWVNFRDRVIQPAVDQINSKTDISVVWKPIKESRSVKAISFNYALEGATRAKPIRPRLFRRPKVTPGSHAEGEWMRKNLKLLIAYDIELKNYDSLAKIEMTDLKKMSLYSKKLGDQFSYEQYEKQINERTNRTSSQVEG
jgi:plasmid replication initiation protein